MNGDGSENVRVAILGHQTFDLCLIPGEVDDLQDRCRIVNARFDDDPSPAVPLLFRLDHWGYGRDKVLGSVYVIEPFPKGYEETLPSCCQIPLVDFR